METVFFDTNIFLRALTGDHAEHAKKSVRFLKRIERGDVRGYTSTLVIAEIIWTLISFYEFPKRRVIEAVYSTLYMENLDIENAPTIAEALALFSESSADFVDCYNAVRARSKRISRVATFDTDWKNFDGIKPVRM